MSVRALRVAAAIIAGGGGKRLGGTDKSSLLVGGRSIAERQVAVLRPRFARVLAVAARAEPWRSLGVDVVADRGAPGRGPLAGIDAALAALREEEDAVVCVASDMPFLVAAALELLRDTAPESAAVVPLVDGRPEPLLARYGRSCGPIVAEALAAGRLKTSLVLDELAVQWVTEAELRALDPELDTLTNVNTPADLSAAHHRRG